jgi:hypothetical protein
MSNSDFENIRPYLDKEVAEIARYLSTALDWSKLLAPLIGEDNADEIAEAMSQIETVSDFQDDLTFPFLEALIEGTTVGVTVSFDSEDVESFFSTPMLHLTNHKDIVLDPSLVNVARMGNGFPSTEVGIGDNLLSQKWVEDLVRLNRCFIVPRGGSSRDKWASSLLVASYIRDCIGRGNSVWLAQKEGRAKDGKDFTSPALIRMLTAEGGSVVWDALNACPVSLSYEWDPCDAFKVRELLIVEKDGVYEKSEGEDESSMALGMTGAKGRVHLHFCEQIKWEEKEGERTERHMASLVDRAIYSGYKVFPNQVLSANYLGLDVTSDVAIEETDRAAFNARLDHVVGYVGEGFNRKEIETKWCEITVQPLLAKLGVRD